MDQKKENMRKPPAELRRAGMLRWFELSLALFAADRHTMENLDVVDELAALADQEARLMGELGLKETGRPQAKEFEVNTDYLELSDPHKFDERFFHYREICRTDEDAYEAVEFEYQQTFQHTKYAGYNSYRNCRDRRQKMQNVCSDKTESNV